MKIFSLFFGLTVVSSLAWAAPSLLPGEPMALPGKAGGFDFMQIDSKNHRLLAAHKKTGHLTLVDLNTGKLLAEVETGTAQGVAVDAKNNRYYVGDDDEKKVVFVDAKRLEKAGEVGVDGPVDAITYDSKNGMIYADEDNGTKIWVIDSKTKKVVAAIPSPGEPEYIEYAPGTDRIYQNIKNKDTVVVIDPNNNTIEATWSTLPAKSPHGLAIDEKTRKLFSAGGNGKLVEIDLATGKVISVADVGEHIDQITFDPETRKIYCAARETISVIRENDTGLGDVESIPSPKGAHTLAVDSQNQEVWIAYADKEKSYLKKYTASH